MPQFLPPSEIDRVLDRVFKQTPWRRTVLKGGLLNQNFLVSAGRERFVLKVYRAEMPASRVAEMHRLMAFVAKRGIPVPLPVVTSLVGGAVVALYPFVVGEHPPRYRGPRTRIRAMGEMLGRIHGILDGYVPAEPKRLPEQIAAAWDPKKAVAEIETLRESLRTEDVSIRREIGDVLRRHERLISKHGWDDAPFRDVPVQYCHGDFHTMNLLMRGDRVTAVLDWEKAGWGFRGAEYMRSVIFNCRKSSKELDWGRIQAYAEGYRMEAQLDAANASVAFETGVRSVVFGFWAVKQYLAGERHLRVNVLRRAAMAEWLVAHRAEGAERMAGMLLGTAA